MWYVFTTILPHHLLSCHFIVAHHKVSIHITILGILGSISGLFLQTMHAMKLWVIRASMGLSAYSTYIFIYCVIYCILYTVYCILYPQEATYQLPKDQMWPTWLFPLLPQSAWPTWKIFHKWQSKVSWLKGLVHMWSLVYNLVMSYLLLVNYNHCTTVVCLKTPFSWRLPLMSCYLAKTCSISPPDPSFFSRITVTEACAGAGTGTWIGILAPKLWL